MVLLFSIIALYINTLRPPKLQLVLPFKIELFWSSRNTLTASMIRSLLQNVFREAWFSVSETCRSQKGPVPDNEGDGEELQSHNQLQQPSQLGMCEHIVVQEQNALSQFIPPFTRDFLTKTSQFVLVRTVHCAALLKIVNNDYPLTIPKK
jgi:hypothetical protein